MGASPYDQRITAGMGVTPGQHSFAQVPSASIQRSVFNRSSGLKTAFDSGYLIPIYTDECLPGDTMALRTSTLVRMTTPLFPVMENIYLDIFYFAVPYRLVWDNFQKMMGERANPADSITYSVPIFDEATVAEGSLSDYLGLPLGTGLDFISLYHRGYALIYNEWFRDQNLQNSVTVDLGNGPDNLANYVLLRRGRRHDYFTSALPFTQKGDPVTLPLGTTAPVLPTTALAVPTFKASTDSGNITSLLIPNAGSSTTWSPAGAPAANATAGWVDPKLYANLSGATAATINDIRYAFQIQKLLERDARGGTRYTEIVRSHFGVVSPDARLQRPEYLGGGTTKVNVHPVPRNAIISGGTNTSGALANLGAFAVAQGDGMGFMKSFTEHTLIIGLANVRCDLTYQQGIHRKFSRRTRYEFYWPELAHLGEQPVLNKEIYADGSANDELVFGYQERWAEYRYGQSITTGRMRSTSATPLDQWHLGLEFGALPVLNASFIESNEPFDRILAVTTEPEFYGDFFFQVRHARPMPTFSVPGFVDHF